MHVSLSSSCRIHLYTQHPLTRPLVQLRQQSGCLVTSSCSAEDTRHSPHADQKGAFPMAAQQTYDPSNNTPFRYLRDQPTYLADISAHRASLHFSAWLPRPRSLLEEHCMHQVHNLPVPCCTQGANRATPSTSVSADTRYERLPHWRLKC